MLEVNELIRSPDLIAQLVSGDQLPRTAGEDSKHATGLWTQTNRAARFAQLTTGGVQLEHTETDDWEPKWGNNHMPEPNGAANLVGKLPVLLFVQLCCFQQLPR